MVKANSIAQKNIAARILKCGKTRVWLDPERMNDVDEAITANDVRKLIKDGIIKAIPKKGISNGRKKKIAEQKKKGRRKGKGSRKGKIGTRFNDKKLWIKRIRIIRSVLKELRDNDKIETLTYRKLYMRSKSGFFRSRAHLNIYLERNELVNGGKDAKKP